MKAGRGAELACPPLRPLPAGATAAFRMADSRDVSALAAAGMLLATLTSACASFRPPGDGSSLRRQLAARHKDGLAVGSLCIPIVCAAILVGDPSSGAWGRGLCVTVQLFALGLDAAARCARPSARGCTRTPSAHFDLHLGDMSVRARR